MLIKSIERKNKRKKQKIRHDAAINKKYNWTPNGGINDNLVLTDDEVAAVVGTLFAKSLPMLDSTWRITF